MYFPVTVVTHHLNITRVSFTSKMFMEEWNDKLIQGVQLEDLELVEKALRNGANVNVVDPYGNTPLANAAQKGNIPILTHLISQGASTEAVGNTGKTPLSRAAYWGRSKAVEFLLAKGADLNSTNPSGNTPLALAVQHRQKEVVTHLIDSGANVSKVGVNGRTPLSWAVQNEDYEMVEFLLLNGGGFTIHTAFLEAIDKVNLNIVKLLRQQGAKVNWVYKNGYSPLTKAVGTGVLEIVDELVQHGADIDMVDGKGNYPLSLSLDCDNFEIANYLIGKGAKVHFKHRGYLVRYLEEKKFQMVRLLVESGARLDVNGTCGFNPLTKAVQIESFPMVQLLVERGASVNQVDDNQNTALAIAATNCDLRTLDYLVSNGAIVNSAMKELEEVAEWNEDLAINLELLKGNPTVEKRESFYESGQEEAPS